VTEQSQIPKHVINSFLAAEDARFFEHHGVDWYRVFGAVVQNVKARRIISGGSTITMQVAKNFLLTRDRTFGRKIKEMILAGPLERAWGKEKILHVYVNEIYLGEGNYGIEAAARGYFDKPVEHLNVSESALIAGLVSGPTIHNPFKNREKARQRQLTVLGRMLKNGFITQAEYQEAKDRELVFRREVVKPLDLAPDFTKRLDDTSSRSTVRTSSTTRG
jgi:penicillin-binding protein 1A